MTSKTFVVGPFSAELSDLFLLSAPDPASLPGGEGDTQASALSGRARRVRPGRGGHMVAKPTISPSRKGGNTSIGSSTVS